MDGPLPPVIGPLIRRLALELRHEAPGLPFENPHSPSAGGLKRRAQDWDLAGDLEPAKAEMARSRYETVSTTLNNVPIDGHAT